MPILLLNRFLWIHRVTMRSNNTFAEESRTIHDIIHSNVDRRTREPIHHPERITFEPSVAFADPLARAYGTGLAKWDFLDDAPETLPDEGPIPGIPGSRFRPVDSAKSQGTKDPLVDVLADEIGLDASAALDSIKGVGTTAIADLTAKF